jgi:ParB/RepB/Spo0J family partition protein
MSKAKKKASKPKAKAKPKPKVAPRKPAKPRTSNIVTISLKDIWMDGKNARDAGWERKLKALKLDIKKKGVLQTIEVAQIPGPKGEPYMLVYGHRRVAACRELKRKDIIARVLAKDTPRHEIYRRRVAENAQGKKLAPMEQARELHLGMTVYKLTAKELGEMYPNDKGEPSSVGWVSQHLQLLKLPTKVQSAVEKEVITATHAREIARVTDPKTQESLLAKAKEMPVTDFKEHVASLDKDKKKKSNRGRKARTDKPTPSPVGEKTGVRSEKEVMKALGELDVRCKEAREKNNKLREEYFKGMVRGIAWVRKMGGVKKLY